MLSRFIIYGLIGWCLEIFWTGLGSIIRGDAKLQGWTYLWMFPIYGMAVFLEPVHNSIRSWPILLRGGVYTLFIFCIEYICGWILKRTIQVCPWDYSKSPFAIKGYIRLDYAPAWFVAGLLFERLHDLLKGLI
ncbi:putative ABC transporter permease [Natronospora cellulosivora (SeqCode)]